MKHPVFGKSPGIGMSYLQLLCTIYSSACDLVRRTSVRYGAPNCYFLPQTTQGMSKVAPEGLYNPQTALIPP